MFAVSLLHCVYYYLFISIAYSGRSRVRLGLSQHLRVKAGDTLDKLITGLTYRDTQTSTLLFTPTDNLQWTINLCPSFWDVGGSRSRQREPTHTQGEHVNTQKCPDTQIKPRTFSLWGDSANHCNTVHEQGLIIPVISNNTTKTRTHRYITSGK